jgi:hypothetical protein
MDGGNPDESMFERIDNIDGSHEHEVDGSGRFSEMGQQVGNQLGQVAQGVGTAADGIEGMKGAVGRGSKFDNHKNFEIDDWIKVKDGKPELKKYGRRLAYGIAFVVVTVIIVLLVLIPFLKSRKGEHLTVRFYEITGIKPRNLRRLRRHNE